MDDIVSGVDPDELMDLDEAEASDLEDEEDELVDDPIPSPFQLPSSGPGSTATSTASSPPNDDMLHFNFSGKPMNIKRGRGRPRREEGKPLSRRQNLGSRARRWKSPGSIKGITKRVKSFDHFDFASVTPSPGDDMGLLDPETGALIFPEREKIMPAPEELPYAPEQWPGKVCAFCNLSERSQLGQGEMLRLTCPEGFTPQRILTEQQIFSSHIQSMEREIGDKSPRGPVTCRRQKSFNKCRHPSMTSEYVDELTIIGYVEHPDVQNLFESSGHFYVHRNCALWSNGVIKNEHSALDNVGSALLQSTSRKCSYCNHYGASLLCRADGCTKMYHYPCATASGAFQELSSAAMFCNQHLVQVAVDCESSVCYTCKMLGDIANLMFCSSCGEHYHGTCVGLAQLPGVRAGWQCRKCRICQVCRMLGDEAKLMSCEQCDKVYHSVCQRPVVTTIPKYGWKCRCCRVCGDCGSRTPGAGLSSRWHAHYTVCDSCYQQRNKGFSCPLCHRAYRAHAHREMVQCTLCRKFVHGSCDPEADLISYHQRKESYPEYEYVCLNCKNLTQPGRQLMVKRNSVDEGTDSLSASQESLYDENFEFDFDRQLSEESQRVIGLGKGKPFYASKVAKKRLTLGAGPPGRPKGMGKVGFMKRQRLAEFGRKRGHKAKMRGVFGVPGVGLQRPVSDGSKDDEPGVENRLILCSAKDKFILSQDVCVMCGALGTDQEGCLISCVQCGQCYHPYCVNVKVTKVILQKGWRCLDCTVCEGCGQRNDESRLILCDDCDISYHIYCMDPPLDYVPHGNWKCKWCAICQSCGTTDPGFNCNWMNSFNECGPCASHNACASCLEPYNEGELIIQCIQCERWLHGLCDSVKTETDAEKCAEEGYNCILCRPRDIPPPHLVPKLMAPKPPTPTRSPEMKSNASYCIDGVFLSERGHNIIKSLSAEQQITRKKRKKLPVPIHDKEAGIMATIESVVAGSSAGTGFDDTTKLELVDIKDEPQELYKEGMIWTKEDGPPPEGFTVYTMESGVCVLRRKRQRNLQKLGIGGFLVRVRGIKTGQENDDVDMLPGQNISSNDSGAMNVVEDKPRRKPARRKPRSKLAESFPPYLQEAFFGKELLDSHKEANSSSSEEEKCYSERDKSIQFSQEEVKDVIEMQIKQDKIGKLSDMEMSRNCADRGRVPIVPKEEDESDTEALKDVLALPGDLLDADLVNTIMNEDDDELTKNTDTLESLADSNLPDDHVADSSANSNNSKDTKDDLSDILGSHFNLESIPNINSKDVEDIFKGVLTDESQESQESNAFPMRNSSMVYSTGSGQPVHPAINSTVRAPPLSNINQTSLNSPMSFPSQSPYHSEYSNSPQFSPAFSEPPSPWVSVNDSADLDNAPTGVSTCNQRSSEKMKADEGLGSGATISAVLYVNVNHPEWKTEFPNWSDRYKQIIKKWRTLSTEQKRPYLQKARDNRSALRMKKQQQSQVIKENASSPSIVKQTAAPTGAAAINIPTTQVPVVTAPVSEVCTHQSRPTPSLTTASTSSVSVSSPNTPKSASPTTQQQFTVHGQFLGSGDHCHGPAPNVTVNPLYQPSSSSSEHGLTPPPRPPAPLPISTPTAADQQIRVLTPSEIMRTLPSLCQEDYDNQSLDQEKLALQQKSAREAEQERQWKQLQALRQQQAQQTNHVIQEQRVQAIARVQRQISDGTPGFIEEQQGVLKSSTTPEPAVVSSTSTARHYLPVNIKSPPFTLLSGAVARPPAQSLSPHDFNTVTSPIEHAKPKESPDSYLQQTPTQKIAIQNFQPRFPVDPYSHQSLTSRSQFASPRPSVQVFNTAPRQDGPDINRQLRDLLQKQQFKKLDEQLISGKGQQRIWPPNDSASATQEQEQASVAVTSSVDATFRHPLPPGIVRPRMPVPVNTMIRQPMPRVQGETRLQISDSRMRLLIQQRSATAINIQQQQQCQPGSQMLRFSQSASVRMANVEHQELLLQDQKYWQAKHELDQSNANKMTINQQVTQPNTLEQKSVSKNIEPVSAVSGNSEQEIPDNVTAELEKLEEESGTMVELHSVGDILGGLGEDDDDILLAEMGADFNILEYADPELEALTGEKTNILDNLDLVEPEPDKDDKKATKNLGVSKLPVSQAAPSQHSQGVKREQPVPQNLGIPQVSTPSLVPPPLAVSQSQSGHPQFQIGGRTTATLHQQHQHMLQQVQQAAALGRPMAVGTKLMSPDGVVGIVTQNNTVQLTFAPNYQQRMLSAQLQQQVQSSNIKTQAGPNSKILMSGSNTMHGNIGASSPNHRLNIGTGIPAPATPSQPPPPPPPPYPGPPPPYPGSASQMGLNMGPSPFESLRLPMGHMHPMCPQGSILPQLQRRSLLLEEQPLLLEELLEQEKREQEKQLQNQPNSNQDHPAGSESENSLLNDHDFVKLKVDVLSSAQVILPTPSLSVSSQVRSSFINRLTTANVNMPQWQQNQVRPPAAMTPQLINEVTPRVPTFNANLLPAPPLPPENIVTEQDKQAQLLYEQWLKHQNNALSQQLKFYETEVQKLRKSRKSLNSKQRQLRKTGSQLADADALELQRISTEQAVLQKHLETSRKQTRQHGMLIQEYQNKQQNKQHGSQMHSGLLMGQQTRSPLAHSSSPIHHSSTPQSPMMSPSPSASPMTQHNSPLSSPGPLVSHSPGSVTNIMQSPTATMSPRIGTPHSQSDGSPGPVQSPSHICLPPPAPRMTSPQHRRVVTSPLGYSGDTRTQSVQGLNQIRFARPPVDSSAVIQQRVRLSSPVQQKPGTPSPLNSPPPSQLNLALQKHIQSNFGQQNIDSSQQNDLNNLNAQRTAQLTQQRQLIFRQQLPQQGAVQQTLTPQQYQLIIQHQLAKQSQLQNRQNNTTPSSPAPLPPKSPLIGQPQNIMSPHSVHSQPPSPMPPRSPMVNFGNNLPPSSPMPRSPVIQQGMTQPPNSPMMHHPPSSPMPRSPMLSHPIQSPIGMRRPPSNNSSPAMPDRPTSVENPRTPYSMQSEILMSLPENDMNGGGNPHNNPIPVILEHGGYAFFKPGLRGGSPMWSLSRGAKRIPTSEIKDDDSSGNNESNTPKPKKESHLSKVSILKKKSPIKTNLSGLGVNKVSSLVSTDYNEFDDSSSTPPATPPPVATTSKVTIHKLGMKLSEHIETKEQILAIDSSPDAKEVMEDMMDYDDDNDNNVVSGEVTLSSAAQQNDGDDITVIETYSQTDLTDVMSSPLESDQIADEFVLFHGNMVVDYSGEGHYSSDKDEEDEYPGELVNLQDKNMHIVNVAIQSPTTSEEELIMQGKTKKVTSGGLTLNIVQGLSSNHLLAMSDTPDSPDQEHSQMDNSPGADEEVLSNYGDSEIVIIDPSVKSPDEQISTKEDFEELIDEGSRNEKIIKPDALSIKHINEIHKYTTACDYNSSPTRYKAVISDKFPPKKVSLIPSTTVQNIEAAKNVAAKAPEVKNQTIKNVTTCITSLILPVKNSVRSNIISVPKLVTSVSPAITIVSASTSQIASILPSRFTVPVISASAVSKLANVKVIDKPSSSLSLTKHDTLPKKIFEDDSISSDNSYSEDSKDKHTQEGIEKPPPLDIHNNFPKTLNSSESKLGEANSVEMQKHVSDYVTSNDVEVNGKQSEKKSNNTMTQTSQSNNCFKEILKSQSENLELCSKTDSQSTSVLLHSTPELKMTAQVIQEAQRGVHITSQSVDTISASFVTSQIDGLDNNSCDLDSKSVVISIPSPTPSQEQMLNNIALQALENRRRDGSGMSGEFESFEDVLDMIENITAEPPTVIEDKLKVDDKSPEAQDNKPLVTTQESKAGTDPTKTKRVQQIVDKAVVNTTSNSVIVPNFKPKVAVGSSAPLNLTTASLLGSIPNSVSESITFPTASSNIFASRSGGGRIQLMPNHPKLPPVTTVTSTNSNIIKPTAVLANFSQSKTSAISTSSNTSLNTSHKSLSLNAMLQSHPAATTPQTSPGTITTASILGSSLGIIRSGFTASLVQAHPKVEPSKTSSQGLNPVPVISSNNNIPTPISTTNLLHTHLTKSFKPTAEEQKVFCDTSTKVEESKIDNSNVSKSESVIDFSRSEVLTKYTTTAATNRMEDSQNVLLKQLLQNTACASTGTVTSSTTTPPTAPSLPIVPNLEAQLARPVPPTPTSLLPSILQNEPTTNQISKSIIQRTAVVTRETSFVSKTLSEQPSPNISCVASQQLHIETKKCMPPSRTPSRDDLLSPPTPRSSCSQDSSLHTPPLTIKKEVISTPNQQNIFLPQEVKKELVDESSQHSEVSDHSRTDSNMKEELTDCLDPSSEKSFLEQKEELKKMKRRAYQQKRRQNHILNKELAGQPKKRPRKSSKVDEDYESYIDGVLGQLRNLPPMTVSEPILNKNFFVVPVFGSGDLTKLGTKDYDSRFGELKGTYGNATIPDASDFYNTDPYGDAEPLPEKVPASTQRGFYDQEFPIIKFDADEDKKFDLFCRDDSPDSIISSSSPECVTVDPSSKFPGLRLISDDEDDEEICGSMRLSPVVPIIAPIPIRLKPAGPYLKDYADMDKENIGSDFMNLKSKFGSEPSTPLKDSGNVTVTLTLTSSAAEDIMGVLRDLANILHIPAPTSYQIVERTSTPPSQKLGLYRTKGKDGKEGAPIDIQSILNGAAKFCRHCDVVILNNMIRKKVSDLPFLSKDSEYLGDGDDLCFCSSTCFMQFALMHRSPSITEDKAAAIIDHLCLKDKMELKKKIYYSDQIDTCGRRSSSLEKMGLDRKPFKKEFKLEPMEIDTLSFERHFQIKSENSSYSHLGKLISHLPPKTHKGIRYRFWTPGCLQASTKIKKPSDKEIMELLYRLNITVSPPRMPEDTRRCMFCHNVSDGVADGPARLLNFDVDKWVHLNCGLWSDGVYETVNGALMNLENALQQSLTTSCVHCNNLGATIRCFKTRCSNVYHLGCAVKDNCVFYKNKTMYCIVHALRSEKDNELTTLSVSRRVYVNRDENRQVAAVMHHSDTNNLLRVGSLIFLNVGQLLPHQLQNFHTANYIYPIGYKIIRFYWSMRRLNRRCRYVCSIHEVSGRPEFRILVQEASEEDLELRDCNPKAVWNKILEPLASLRRENQCIHVFPKYVSGEDLFGLTEPAVVRVLESLPGIETLTDYKFKYGRNPLLELPLAINPSGAARTEPRLRNQLHWKRPHTQRTGSSVRPVFVSTVTGVAGETACPYSKQFVHSKSSQYKKMKQEWRNNVYLARSKIQGLGLYAARDLEKHTMVIEYIGEIIRTELAETREKKYEAKNRGIYMFRLDEERVVDATLSGGLARYINHSCNPNCVAEIVEVDRDLRIIIFAKRRIQRGEELAYDYKFDIEDDQHKISCMCGAPNCRKWMN